MMSQKNAAGCGILSQQIWIIMSSYCKPLLLIGGWDRWKIIEGTGYGVDLRFSCKNKGGGGESL